MIEDQKYILNEILTIVKEQQPQAVLIAGDVYDTANPSAEAVALLSLFLKQLHSTVNDVFILSGNHDSADRLAFGASIMDEAGMHFSRVYSKDMPTYTLKDEFGEVHFYLLPFIKPIDVRSCYREQLTECGKTIDTYTNALEYAIEQMRVDYSQRNILLAHQYMVGAERTDGEDMPTIGGVDEVNASVMKDFDYVALGHLHKPQHVNAYPYIRYSGSPLKYSFSETDHYKSVTVLEIGQKGCPVSVREIPLIPLHDWTDIQGSYDELMSSDFRNGKGYENNYVRVTLTDELDVLDAMNKLRTCYPYIMKLQYDNSRTRALQDTSMASEVEKKSPTELVSEFYCKQNGQPMTQEQQQLINLLIEEIFV